MKLKMDKTFRYLKKRYKFHATLWKQRHNIKIVVGAGKRFQDDWAATDIDMLNIAKKSDWKRLFRKNSIQAILAEHVWEHLNMEDGILAINNCFTYLKKGGYLRIAVPDGFHPDVNYINYVKVGGSGPGADDHKVLFNYQGLSALLVRAGFQVDLLEYFDENGEFHAKNWDPADGKITRSIRFDNRNSDGRPNYTSLILDARKVS